MSRAYFAHIRASTVRQGERGSSLIEQRSAIEAYATRAGLSITQWFEETETAAKQGRRTFSVMMNALRAGRADGLLIHKIDRSARNLRDWSDLGDLIDRGADVRFVSDNFDLLSRGGRLSADIQAVVAADYIRNLREEVKKGMYGRLKQGLYPWGAPLGNLDMGGGKPKAVDPVKGPLVRQLFERYATNTVSLERLRFDADFIGLRKSRDKPLSPNVLSEVFHNSFYVGVIRIRTTDETFPGVHEPLVTKEVFERVQAILRGKTAPKANKHQFLLRHRVKCEDCGRRTLSGDRHLGHIYYRCHGANCRLVSWRGEDLEGVARDHIARIRLDLDELRDIGDLIRAICSEQERDTSQLQASFSLSLQNVDARLTRLTDLLIDGVIDRETCYARKEGLLLERQGIVEALNRAKHQLPLAEHFERFERTNHKLLGYEMLIDDEKRELLDIV